MVSVIVSAGGDERGVVATLAALVPGAAAGLIRDVQLINSASDAALERVADIAGCHLLIVTGPKGLRLAEAAKAAKSPWLLFLHAGSIPDGRWIDEMTQFVETASLHDIRRAAVFRYARSPYATAKLGDAFKLAGRWLRGPSAEQGLLISRAHYDALGGHDATSERAEAKLLSRLGRKDRILFRSHVIAASGAP